MELPTLRELELETLLRERDSRVTELTDEITLLRQFLSVQPGPSTTEPLSLPPPFVSLLLPHINSVSHGPGTTSSNTVTAALTQRAKLLQEENDELYELLKSGETGKLKEEVRGLRRVVEKLEAALIESHNVIETISTELDKSYEALMHSSRQADNSKSHSRSPRNSYRNLPQSVATGNGTHASKLPPTGPRIHKKPRLSEPHPSPARSNAPLPPQKVYAQSHIPASRGSETREYAPRYSTDNRSGKPNHIKMEVDEDTRSKVPGPPTDRERFRERERDRDRERDRGPKERPRDRDRDRDNSRSVSRRNNFSSSSGRGGAGSGGGSGRRVDRGTVPNNFPSPDRTLAERMGL